MRPSWRRPAACLKSSAGSGYAAAVMSPMAAQVYAIQRHASPAHEARRRCPGVPQYRTAGVGDGRRGWPAAAPFRAILLVAASAPEPPRPLREQVSVGGRLLVPAGPEGQVQRLRKIRRVGRDRYQEQHPAAIRLVPPLGEQAGPIRCGRPMKWAKSDDEARADLIARAAEPLPDPAEPQFAAAFDRFADRRVVLLGESSHGTAEFYQARAAITRRLVERHGFRLLAFEADWPDAAAVNRHVRGRESGGGRIFQRFPTWMWRNTEVAVLVDWLKAFNRGRADGEQAGFHGLDMYSMRESIAAVLEYMDRVDPEAAAVARERYGRLTPWQNSPSTYYGHAALRAGHAICEQAVLKQCRELLDQRLSVATERDEARLDAAQNARLVAAAERYYRAMYHGGAESWNLRDTHMFETLRHLMRAYGSDARAVV